MNVRLRTTEEVAGYLQVPVATLYAWRNRNIGPRAVRVGRHLRYRQEDIEAWLQENAGAPRGSAA